VEKVMRTAVLALLGSTLMLGGACAPKKAAQPSVLDKVRAEAQAAEAKRDAWMTQGTYVSGKTEWQEKIIQAVEKTETLANYQIGLYSDSHAESLEFDGEMNQGDFHFHFNRNHREVPIEFFILQDRYYSQEGDSLLDNGPNSRSTGEKLFMPLLQEVRSAVKQAARGEIKDVGPVQYEKIPVHKYDLKIGLPGDPPQVLTATVEIDEARGLLLHAVVGSGVGSESAEKRFQKVYRELAFTKIGGIGNVALPGGVPVTPYQEDINNKKMGAP
jgi:hypothetical protein